MVSGRYILNRSFAMLRLSPTIISLSKRDVKEHLENISRKAGAVQCDGIVETSTARLPLQLHINCEPVTTEYARGTFRDQRNCQSGTLSQARITDVGLQTEVLDDSFASRGLNGNDGDEADLLSSSLPLLPANRLESPEENEALLNEDGYISAVFSPSDDFGKHVDLIQQLPFQDSESRRRLTPPEHAFDYGGFVQSSTSDSSWFVPEDSSTPHETRVPNLQRLRARNPLPRSPLFRSYNPRYSPERNTSVGLTQRLASPGIPRVLFSHPARRPKNYRNRTSSYSFEEPEKISPAYEDVTASEPNSQIALSLPTEGCSLTGHRGTSFQSSNGEVSIPSSPPEYNFHANVTTPTGGGMVLECTQTSCLSSPSLQLPPPFSAVSRSGSATGSLPVRMLGATTPSPRQSLGGRADGPSTPSPELVALGDTPGGQEVQRSPSSTETTHSIVSLPLRLLSAYRSRSPIGSWPLSSRAPATPLRSSRGSRNASPAPPTALPNTPYRRLRVYDDRVPASLQPQTPQHLPEARHQSRYHSSFTAPVGQPYASPHQLRAGFRRGRGTRSESPLGLDTPGFTGLYGGQENTDDDVMFERVAQRLFLRREGGGNRRSGSNTPERDVRFGEA